MGLRVSPVFFVIYLTKSPRVSILLMSCANITGEEDSMEFLFDTANLDKIKAYQDFFPITGVTSNPSILKAEGKIDFFEHMRKVRALVGPDKSLHIQVIAEDCEGIVREAYTLLRHVDGQVYVKIPTTREGLKAMRVLKGRGVHITATAVYSRIQGFLAIAAGADYIAPYDNRMENMDIASADTIAAFRKIIDQSHASTKILAASFKNIAQVNEALLAGAHAVTVQPDLLNEAFNMPSIQKAVDDFHKDWVQMQGDIAIDAMPDSRM